MFPKLGNAFAQAKALELEKQRNSRDSTQLTAVTEEDPNKSTTDANKAHNSVDTTFDMFTGDLPMTKSRSQSPTKPKDHKSPDKRSVTDPEKYKYARQSAVPEPLFHPNPVANLFNRFTIKRSSASKDKIEQPPRVPEKDSPAECTTETVKENSTMPTLNGVQEDAQELNFPVQRSRTTSRSSQASQASSQSRRRGDPIYAIHNAHDTRYAFTPITTMYQNSGPTISRRFIESPVGADGMILGPSAINPTRDGKYARTKQAEFVEQSRIPSYAGSIVSAGNLSDPLSAALVSPQLWIGPDGRVYSGPLLPSLSYRPPTGHSGGSRSRNSAPYSDNSSSSYPAHSSDGNASIQTPSVYAIAGGGAWEQLQAQHPNTMPSFQGLFARPRAPSNTESDTPDEVVTSSHSSEHSASSDLSAHDKHQDNEITPKNKSSQGLSGDHTTPSKGGSRSHPTEVIESDIAEIENGEFTQQPTSPGGDKEVKSGTTSRNSALGGHAIPPPFANYQGPGTFDAYFVDKFANLDQHFVHLQNQYAVLEGQYANLEQRFDYQSAYLEHSVDHIVDHRLELAVERLRRHVDESCDKLGDKILGALSNKIVGKQTELLDRQNEAVHLSRNLSEQLKLLVDTSVKDFEKLQKLEKLSLRSEQNIRVDLSKISQALQALRDEGQGAIQSNSPSKKQEQSSTPEPLKTPMRRQLSVGSLSNATNPGSVVRHSPSPTKSPTPKPRKLTPMPGMSENKNGPKPVNGPRNPPITDNMKAASPRAPITRYQNPDAPTDQVGIGIATTTTTSIPSSSTITTTSTRRKAYDDHHQHYPNQSKVLSSDPIKKPHPQRQPAAYPPATRTAFNNGNHNSASSSVHPTRRAGNVTFADPSSDTSKKHNPMTNTTRESAGAASSTGAKQASEVWNTAGNWYERAYGGAS